jgi:hypothetical protein
MPGPSLSAFLPLGMDEGGIESPGRRIETSVSIFCVLVSGRKCG